MPGAVTLAPLLVDASAFCRIRASQWAELARNPAYVGVILKATEGLGGTGGWFRAHWPAVGALKLHRGAYHFLRLDSPGVAQADHFLRTIDRAGGWSAPLDLWPVVDIEEGSGNDEAVSRRGTGILADTARAFAERVKLRTGRDVMLYAGGWLRGLGLRDPFGCEWLWLAAYTSGVPDAWCEQLGLPRAKMALHQYDGSGSSNGLLPGYPTRAPIEHGEDLDISVLTLPGGVERLRSLLWAERPG